MRRTGIIQIEICWFFRYNSTKDDMYECKRLLLWNSNLPLFWYRSSLQWWILFWQSTHLQRFAQNRKEGRRLGWACLLGGDEFSAALFFDYDVPEEIMYNRAGEIFEKLQTAFHELTPRVSLSVGAAVSDSGSTFNDLYKNADEALYEAKNNGRDRIGFR